ncbi:chloride ion channel protein [Clostridium sp. CAG:411]|jgi:H+/Cl- antiporter ClcA|nr:chloride channel protein [Lachnospiraceae bacterium]CDE42903.1 chloride ion channel protein [Clostridium sp. CAG:411]
MRTENKYIKGMIICIVAVAIGAAVGAIDALFGRVLLLITDVRDAHPGYFVPFLAFAGLFIVFAYERYGGKSSRGMVLLFDVAHGKEKEIPLRLIPFVTIGTWITHLFGGSAGREGVAVQIGGTLSYEIGRKLPIKNASNILLIVGMAAGFGGLFRTPVAATFFAVEVLTAGILVYEAIFPAFLAAYTASIVSGKLGLEKFACAVNVKLSFDEKTILKLIVLGALFGIVGYLFSKGLQWGKKQFSKWFPNKYIRIGVTGAFLSIFLLAIYFGRYAGLGTNLIHASFYGEQIYLYDWVLKLVFTIITLAAGFQGGEVTPLFSIGASLGVVLSGVFGLPVEFVAALGYAAVFGSATNTMLAPIFIGGEVFGFANIPYFALVCMVAFVINRNSSIYAGQKLYAKEQA